MLVLGSEANILSTNLGACSFFKSALSKNTMSIAHVVEISVVTFVLITARIDIAFNVLVPFASFATTSFLLQESRPVSSARVAPRGLQQETQYKLRTRLGYLVAAGSLQTLRAPTVCQ